VTSYAAAEAAEAVGALNVVNRSSSFYRRSAVLCMSRARVHKLTPDNLNKSKLGTKVLHAGDPKPFDIYYTKQTLPPGDRTLYYTLASVWLSIFEL